MTAAVPDRFRDQLEDVLVQSVGAQMPRGKVWRPGRVLDALLPTIAAEVEARVQAAEHSARRAQQTWDRKRAEEYAAVVGVDLSPSDDLMDAVDELYRAGVQAAANQRAAEELRAVAARESDTIADTILALADDFLADLAASDPDPDAVYDWLIRQAAVIRAAAPDSPGHGKA